ncbi:DUF4190 domain-containing protein [Agromyces sp. Marseille-Q5079]|uniref:DUF4190 domain-containing protein n=1 Tax=Agromyces sp. Marseille-Q5079 TaxID=3439059 RepID=UPI003D9C8CA9
MDAPTPTPTLAAPTAPDGGIPFAGSLHGASATSGVAPDAIAPIGVVPVWTPPASAPQNVLAWVTLGLGLGSMMFGLLTAIPAIVCGHIARRQIRQRGEQGAQAALIGIIFGYVLGGLYLVGITLYVAFIVLMLVFATTAESGVTSSL